MGITPDMLERVLGAQSSVTRALLAMRRTPGEGELSQGVWYSNFTRVKTEAAKRGLPFFAFWTNGEQCSLCRRFTANILAPRFQGAMKSSRGLWWCGSSADDNAEDGRDGAGFVWCQGPSRKVSFFPFFAVSFVLGGKTVFDFFGSGGDYDGGSTVPDEGAMRIVSKIAGLFKSAAQREGARAETGATDPGGLLHIRFNPRWDAQKIIRFQEAMKTSGGHCLCQPQSNDSMCMCRQFLERDKPGLCRCGAFEKFIA